MHGFFDRLRAGCLDAMSPLGSLQSLQMNDNPVAKGAAYRETCLVRAALLDSGLAACAAQHFLKTQVAAVEASILASLPTRIVHRA